MGWREAGEPTWNPVCLARAWWALPCLSVWSVPQAAAVQATKLAGRVLSARPSLDDALCTGNLAGPEQD